MVPLISSARLEGIYKEYIPSCNNSHLVHIISNLQM